LFSYKQFANNTRYQYRPHSRLHIRSVTFLNVINFSINTRTQPKIGYVSGQCEQLCNIVWISKLTELTAGLEQ